MLAVKEKQSKPTRTDYGILRDMVQSPNFQREVVTKYGGSKEEVGIYFSGITVIGVHKQLRPNYYQAELLLTTFISNIAMRQLVRVSLSFELPKDWDALQISDHFYNMMQTLHRYGTPTKVGRVIVYWGSQNFSKVIDNSVQEYMVGKLLQDEERCSLIEDRILYHTEKLEEIKAMALDVRELNGYQVFTFPITEHRYLGVTCGVVWLGRYGSSVKDVKIVYDLTKMTMSQAKKEVTKACQTKTITDMLYWFISFADMRKKMPTVSTR